MKKNFTTAPFGILLPLTLAMILGVPAGNSADVTPTSQTPSVKTKSATVTTETGIASYYGSKYHGKPTASGEIFNMNELTAAHPKLAFGTRVKVTHLESQRSVVVRINDRGPFVPGRIIDLSQAAAAELQMVRSGVARVTLEVLK